MSEFRVLGLDFRAPVFPSCAAVDGVEGCSRCAHAPPPRIILGVDSGESKLRGEWVRSQKNRRSLQPKKRAPPTGPGPRPRPIFYPQIEAESEPSLLDQVEASLGADLSGASFEFGVSGLGRSAPGPRPRATPSASGSRTPRSSRSPMRRPTTFRTSAPARGVSVRSANAPMPRRPRPARWASGSLRASPCRRSPPSLRAESRRTTTAPASANTATMPSPWPPDLAGSAPPLPLPPGGGLRSIGRARELRGLPLRQ